jgi:hypothetical protein
MNTPQLPDNCKPIPNYPHYCARTDGALFSCFKRGGHGRIGNTWLQLRAGANNKYGHLFVIIVGADGRMHHESVHRLILAAFVGPCPAGMEACHNNGNAGDNRIENLRWDTKKSNSEDQKKHGKSKGVNHYRTLFTDSDIYEIRQRATNGETQQSIAASFGCSRTNILHIVHGISWSHLPGAIPRTGLMKGESHYATKLTNNLIREIRQRSENNETAQAIANDLGLQRRNVSRIIDRTRWGHVI